MSDKLRLSVILSEYSNAERLDAAINSIFELEGRLKKDALLKEDERLEIIVVISATLDNIVIVIEKWDSRFLLKKLNKIKICRTPQETTKAMEAMEMGINMADGNCVMILSEGLYPQEDLSLQNLRRKNLYPQNKKSRLQNLHSPGLKESLKKMVEEWQAGKEINIGYRYDSDEQLVKGMEDSLALAGSHDCFCCFLIDRRIVDLLKEEHPHRHSDLATRIFSLREVYLLHPIKIIDVLPTVKIIDDPLTNSIDLNKI